MVMIHSATLLASLAFATVVLICSCWRSDETMLRSIRSRWDESRESLRKAIPWRMMNEGECGRARKQVQRGCRFGVYGRKRVRWARALVAKLSIEPSSKYRRLVLPRRYCGQANTVCGNVARTLHPR